MVNERLSPGDRVTISFIAVVSDSVEPNPSGDFVWVKAVNLGPVQVPLGYCHKEGSSQR